MKPMRIAAAALAGALALATAPARAVEQPLRWIKVDDLRVRGGPGWIRR